MILVLLGTQNNSFFRLLDEIENCINKGIIEDNVIVQAGHTKYNSNKMEILDFTSQTELENLMLKADLIITHGGVGSIVNGLKLNKKIIAVPRLAKYNEHVNDHQLQIIEFFANQDYIIGIFDVCDLESALNNINKFTPKKYVGSTKNILNIISNYIDNN